MSAGGEEPDTFHHISDAAVFELPFGREFVLPRLEWFPSADYLLGTTDEPGLQITKFMVLQAAAILVALLLFVPLARKVRSGDPVRGRFWNFWESILVFIRDEVVRPTIGDPHDHDDFPGHGGPHDADPGLHAEGQHDPAHADPLKQHRDYDPGYAGTESLGANQPVAAIPGLPAGLLAATGNHPADRYLPLVWSLFFYVLFANLFGAIPFLGSATGNISVTAVLAAVVFGVVLLAGFEAAGFVGFFKGLVPSMELPGWIAPVLLPLIWVIELFGLLVKHFVLAVRLFANIMAGHTVIGVFLGFIWAGRLG